MCGRWYGGAGCIGVWRLQECGTAARRGVGDDARGGGGGGAYAGGVSACATAHAFGDTIKTKSPDENDEMKATKRKTSASEWVCASKQAGASR